MKQEKIIATLVILGDIMDAASKEMPYQIEWKIEEKIYLQLLDEIERQKNYNGWFTKKAVQFSLASHAKMLNQDTLQSFCSNYSYTDHPKKVAVIMAGNLPLVGFHDFLCTLLSGNVLLAKLSSDDARLFPLIFKILIEINADIATRLYVVKGSMKEMQAVIATGSDNSLKYFEQYFGKYPHIFRSNRTSVAVLDGKETKEQLFELGKDIFQYFGLGCRNVTHLLIPKEYDINTFFEGIFPYHEVVNHHKYVNNFDYQRATHLLNQIPFLENNFILLKETDELQSPLAMLYYHRYENQKELENYLKLNDSKIQVVIGNNYHPFGSAQTPNITDFADNMDTMKFLNGL